MNIMEFVTWGLNTRPQPKPSRPHDLCDSRYGIYRIVDHTSYAECTITLFSSQ